MDFAKLVSLLDRRALFFARADRLNDPFEGSLSEQCRRRVEQWADETGVRDSAFETLTSSAGQERKRAVASCRHEQLHESEAMWGLHGTGRPGIAVRTDVRPSACEPEPA